MIQRCKILLEELYTFQDIIARERGWRKNKVKSTLWQQKKREKDESKTKKSVRELMTSESYIELRESMVEQLDESRNIIRRLIKNFGLNESIEIECIVSAVLARTNERISADDKKTYEEANEIQPLLLEEDNGDEKEHDPIVSFGSMWDMTGPVTSNGWTTNPENEAPVESEEDREARIKEEQALKLREAEARKNMEKRNALRGSWKLISADPKLNRDRVTMLVLDGNLEGHLTTWVNTVLKINDMIDDDGYTFLRDPHFLEFFSEAELSSLENLLLSAIASGGATNA
jgi:hypothetical protein